MTSKIRMVHLCAIFLIGSILSCEFKKVHNSHSIFSPSDFVDSLKWVHEGRNLPFQSFSYLWDGFVLVEDSLGDYRVYSEDSLPHAISHASASARFLRKMLRMGVKEVDFTPEFIEVKTIVSDSTYSELKHADRGFYDRANFDFEDRDPNCRLVYTFVIIDIAKPSDRREIAAERGVYHLHWLIADSVIWYRSCF